METTPFNWSEYHSLARELVTRSSNESCLRTAVSRAYYYVFHLARQRLLDNQFLFLEKQDSHKQVWEKYTGSPDYDCRKLAEIAKRLKEKREAADYEVYFPQLAKDAPVLVASAEDFASRLNKLDKRLPTNTGVRR
jgi:uncharacterized protein (UPF0332 family)